MLPLYIASVLGRRRLSTAAAASHKLFDCDLNLTLFTPQDAARELEIAHEQCGLAAAIVPGSSLADSIAAHELCRNSLLSGVRLYSTFGVHPYNATEMTAESKQAFVDAARHHFGGGGPPVAMGECGLDASPGFPPLDVQLAWFRLQLDLAGELAVPLFLHERGAHDLFMRELESRRPALKSKNKLLVHCFTGSEHELRRYLDFGCVVSVSGVVCRKDRDGKRVRQAITACQPAPHSLLIETDAPYMHFPGCRKLCATEPDAKSPNVPSALPQVAIAVSQCLLPPRDSYASVCRDSYNAAAGFFGV